MAACARRQIVRKGASGIYHCWHRCVRRAWLFGVDTYTGTDYSHRRQWIIQRLMFQAECFAIDVCFSAIMSNHFHLVLRTLPGIAQRWSDEEVSRRWLRLCPGKWVLDGNWIEPTPEQIEILVKDKTRIEILRQRLADVSWFMGRFAEYIARRANAEEFDGEGGRFFQGRFGCRECTNEASLLICGMYVDLNQVRAGEAATLGGSEHCSLWWRLQGQGPLFESDGPPAAMATDKSLDGWLAKLTLAATDLGDVPSTSGRRASDKGLLPVSLTDYVRLLEFVGRKKDPDKRGVLSPELSPILARLGLREEDIAETVYNFPSLFRRIAGTAKQIAERATAVGRKWFHGIRAASRVFTETAESPNA